MAPAAALPPFKARRTQRCEGGDLGGPAANGNFVPEDGGANGVDGGAVPAPHGRTVSEGAAFGWRQQAPQRCPVRRLDYRGERLLMRVKLACGSTEANGRI